MRTKVDLSAFSGLRRRAVRAKRGRGSINDVIGGGEHALAETAARCMGMFMRMWDEVLHPLVAGVIQLSGDTGFMQALV